MKARLAKCVRRKIRLPLRAARGRRNGRRGCALSLMRRCSIGPRRVRPRLGWRPRPTTRMPANKPRVPEKDVTRCCASLAYVDTLGRRALARRAAGDQRSDGARAQGALNGVAVNLEVVRSRSAPDGHRRRRRRTVRVVRRRSARCCRRNVGGASETCAPASRTARYRGDDRLARITARRRRRGPMEVRCVSRQRRASSRPARYDAPR